MSKIVKSGRFLGRAAESLIKVGLPLMNNKLSKSVSIPLGLTAAAADAGIH